MAFDEIQTEFDSDLSSDLEGLAGWQGLQTPDAHEEDRLLSDLQRWARSRGFGRTQRAVLREALLQAFDQLPELPTEVDRDLREAA